MEKNSSLNIFIRNLNERQQEFKKKFDDLLSILVDGNKDEKRTSTENCLQSANSLKNNLSHHNYPGWLTEVITSFNWYLSHFNSSNSSPTFLKKLIPFVQQINNHNWKFEDSKIPVFSFDAIYEKCKKESKIDELFEEIISLLQKILESEEVDSLKIRKLIEKAIATLKQHHNASYFALHGMRDFLVHLLRNVFGEQLESLPGVGPFIKGLKKTLIETDVEFSELHEQVKKEIQSKVKEEFNTNISVVSYDTRNLLE